LNGPKGITKGEKTQEETLRNLPKEEGKEETEGTTTTNGGGVNEKMGEKSKHHKRKV